MRDEPEQLRPEELDLETLLDTKTLILGAPRMGKSRSVDEVDNPEIVVKRSLDKANKVDSEKTIVVDDLYQAYQKASEDQEAEPKIRSLLNRKRGVCFVTRPRCLEWIINEEGPDSLTAEDFREFEQVYYLRYSTEKDEDKDSATEATKAVLDEDEEVDEGKLSTIKYTGYGFAFGSDSGLETKALPEYPETYAPMWADVLTLESNRRWLSADGAKRALDAARDWGANFGLSESLNGIQEAATEIVTSSGVALGSAAVGAPLGFAGGIAVWLALRDEGPGSDSIFDSLLDVEMTPETKEKIEQAYGLPPYTIDNLLELSSEENLEAIRQVCENPPEELREDVDHVTSRLDAMEEQLESLSRTVEEIEEEVQKYGEILNIESATVDFERLGAKLRREEAILLDKDSEEIDIEELTASYQGDEPEKIVDDVDDGGVVVLRGPHGTGKTTAAYVACSRLREDHEVVVPRFEGGSNLDKIRYVLEQSDDTVVYAAFGGGEDHAFNDGSQLQKLLEWTAEGLVESVLIETRRSRHGRLKEEANRFTEGRSQDGVSEAWNSRRQVLFERKDTEKDREKMEDIVEYAFGLLSYKPEEGDVDSVIETAEGNPEIAKIAARYTATEDESLDEFDSAHDLVWDDIKGMVGVSGEQDGCQELFEYLCAVRGMETEGAKKFCDSPEECASKFSGYLGEDVRRGLKTGGLDGIDWNVTPEIYADVVFRHRGLEFSEYQRKGKFDTERFQTYLNRLNDAGVGVSGLAQSLAVEYDFASREEPHGGDYREHVLDKVGMLLDEADGRSFFASFETLVWDDVPVDPSVVIENSEAVVRGSGARAESLGEEIDAETVAENLLSKLLQANVEAETDAKTNEAVLSFPSEFDRIRDEEADAAGFLENVYSMAVRRLAQSNPDPNEKNVQDWLDEINERVFAVECEGVPSDPDFPANVTSMAIARIQQTGQQNRTIDVRGWTREALGRSVGEVDEGDLHEYSDEFQRQYYAWCQQFGVLPKALPVLVALLVGRVTGDDLVLDTEDERVELVSEAVADSVFGVWKLIPDRELELGRSTLDVLGQTAVEDAEFFINTLSRVDERISESEVADWILENADPDAPVQPLRDRVVGHAYAGATQAVEENEEADVNAEDIVRAVEFDGTEPATRLYRAGLRAIHDNNADVAFRLLRAAWLRREHTDAGTTAHDHTVAAGAGYAAHLTLVDEEESEKTPEEVAEEIRNVAEDFSEPASAVLEASVGVRPDLDADELAEGIDPDAETHDTEKLEALAYSELLPRLIDIREKYREGLEKTVEGDRAAAVSPLMDVWHEHDESEDSKKEHRRLTLNAGVAVAAHVADDPVLSSTLEEVIDAVSGNEEILSEPARTVFEAMTDSGTDTDTTQTPSDLREKAEEKEGIEELEVRAFTRLLELERE